MIKTINGDLLKAKEEYIAHQCNCVTNNAAGLAKSIYQVFPYANVYADRTDHSMPGTIQICGNGKDQRYVINMFSQYYPGGAWDDFDNDTPELRLHYFEKCLIEISEIPAIKSIAFPYKIGCGIAGGNWKDYYEALVKFSELNNNIDVTLYRL